MKSVLTYKVLILGTYHPHTVFLREEGCVNSWLLFESKGVRGQESWGNSGVGTCYNNENLNTTSFRIANDSRKRQLKDEQPCRC